MAPAECVAFGTPDQPVDEQDKHSDHGLADRGRVHVASTNYSAGAVDDDYSHHLRCEHPERALRVDDVALFVSRLYTLFLLKVGRQLWKVCQLGEVVERVGADRDHLQAGHEEPRVVANTCLRQCNDAH